MRITHTRHDGFGDCVMLSRYGEVYPCIDNAYHPNVGEAYSEIERVVDWLYEHSPIPELDQWVNLRVAEEWYPEYKEDLPGEDEIILNVMYSTQYTPHPDTINSLKRAIEDCNDARTRRQYLAQDEEEICQAIESYLNENFLRIRAGGKLNPEGTNTIYFRISSHGFDWRGNIEDFLWDTFESMDDMPEYIWIGHDEETNPPEVTLYEGSPEDLLGVYDTKVLAAERPYNLEFK